MLPEVFNNKERHPKLSFLERDANLVLPFLTLGYGKRNIRERRGERDCYVGRRDRAVTLNIYTASQAGIVQNISSSSSSITKLQTNQLRRVRVFIILIYRDCQFRNSKKLMFDVCYNLESFDIY